MRLGIFVIAFVGSVCGGSTKKTEQLMLQSITVQNIISTTPTTQSSSTIQGSNSTFKPSFDEETLSATPEALLLCSDITSVTFCGHTVVKYTCIGGLYQGQSDSGLSLTVAGNDGVVNFIDPATWTLSYNGTNGTAGVFIIHTISGSAGVPKSENSAFPISKADAILGQNVSVTAVAMRMVSQTTNNNNTQAVVVAVLEGLIILAIIIVFAYKECFAKGKQRPPSMPSGTASYSANPYGSSGSGVNYGAGGGGNGSYYDNAAAAYRQNNPSSTTQRNPSYGYDQPVRSETASAAPSTTQNRVQTDIPALVPVPLTSDPLNEWGDQRSFKPADDLFS